MLVDATEPFGFNHVFPRGTLREPLTSASRADVIAITKCEFVLDAQLDVIENRYRLYAPKATYIRVEQRPLQLLASNGDSERLSAFDGKRIAAFCAIGNPTSFRSTLESIGAKVEWFREFPDHHEFTRSDVDSVGKSLREANVEMCICTAKDLVKLNIDRIAGIQLYALQIDLAVVEGNNALEQRLMRIANTLE